jgi:hypothetical protein
VVLETETKNYEEIRKRVNYQTSKSIELGDISETSTKNIPDPIETLKKESAPTLNELTEAIIYWCQKEFGEEFVVAAHQSFQKQTGVVFPEDKFYHERMGYFLDHLIFQQQLEGETTVYQKFMNSDYLKEAQLPEPSTKALVALQDFEHSVFVALKANSKKLVIRNLINKSKVEVLGQGLEFFNKMPTPVLFQGFIFKLNDHHHLSRGIIQHNPKANRQISKNFKAVAKSKESDTTEELFLLAKQNLTYLRLKNVSVKQAYKRP